MFIEALEGRRLLAATGFKFITKITGAEDVSTPAGDKPALAVQTSFERLPHPDFDPKHPPPRIELQIYFAEDASRAPLAFVVKTKKLSARGDLTRWSIEGKAGGEDKDWTF